MKMPIYDFKCSNCEHEFWDFFKANRPEGIPERMECPKCHSFSATKQVSLAHTDLKGFHTPIEMHSIACLDGEQIREMQRAGIECSDDENNPLHGVPVARNRKEKLKALEVAGFTEKS
jgi:putative FmdB family regulatory protein